MMPKSIFDFICKDLEMLEILGMELFGPFANSYLD